MRLLGTLPPEQTTYQDVNITDPVYAAAERAYDVARQTYEAEKRTLLAKQAETLARLRRNGYEFEVVTRRDMSADEDVKQ